MFKSIRLDAKFDDIKDCFDSMKYIFPSNCKIKISLLKEGETRRSDAEKLPEEMQDVYVNGSITDQEKKLEITPEDFSQIISEEVMKDKLSTEEDEEKKSKISSAQRVKNVVKKKTTKKKGFKKKLKIEEKVVKVHEGETHTQLNQNKNIVSDNEIEESLTTYRQKIVNEYNMADRIKEILAKHGKDISELYLADNIPTNKMNNAKNKCEITEDETIIGILDLTLLGSAKNCFVFGSTGIYFHNSIFSKNRGTYYFSYDSLKNCNFELEGKYEIKFDNNHHLNVDIYSMCKKKSMKIVDILNNIKDTI